MSDLTPAGAAAHAATAVSACADTLHASGAEGQPLTPADCVALSRVLTTLAIQMRIIADMLRCLDDLVGDSAAREAAIAAAPNVRRFQTKGTS